MDLVYYPQLSGTRYLTYSIQTNTREQSVLDTYISSITTLSETTGCIERIRRLASGKLNTRKWDTYHGYPAFGTPEIYVIKHKQHRLFLLYDTCNGTEAVIYFYCFRKKAQKLTQQQKNRILIERNRYLMNKGTYTIREIKGDNQ